MHHELLATGCLLCYSGEKYPKVPYSQPPLQALWSPSKSPSKGQEAAQAKACRQACLTLNPHPRQGGNQRLHGEGTGSLILSNFLGCETGLLSQRS